MALQHATHDVGGATHETASPGEKTAGAAAPAGTGGPKGRVLRTLCAAFRPHSRAGRSMWRTVAVAALTYIVAINLSYFLVLKPVWSRLNTLVEKKGVIQDFLVVRESAAAVSRFKDGLMRGDQRMTVVAEFEDLAQEAGLRMTGEPGLLQPREISKRIMEYPVEIDLRGTYHDVGRFLSLLAASPRCPSVSDVEVTAREGGSGQCDVRLRIGVAAWVD
ncbi:MAG: type 4a pilus biogenesis protein PilO [Candidatus Eisenbacteria bacterium]|nr:type 4a pilus biogenesis protein PilO [Candidatus Eisenbacteria bacterium]